MAKLGWLGLGISESLGGHGGRLADQLMVVQELARGLVSEPVVSTTIVSAHLLEQGGPAGQSLLRALVDGDLRCAWAHEERPEPVDMRMLQTRAQPVGDRWSLRGRKSLVADAPHAHDLIVSARIEDAGSVDREIALFVVPVDQQALRMDRLKGFDRRRYADCHFDGVVLSAEALIARGSQALVLIGAAQSRWLAALAAEGLGIAEKLLVATTDYLKTREQFGAKLASFQVLQHRLVDLFIAVEELRTAARLATISCEAQDQRMLAAVRIKLIQILPALGRQAVQLHGGMGMTDEFHVGDCMKRLESIALQCGPIEQALDQFSAADSDRAVV
jgi:alkylation response protein AidB-like acyl-CoA dehydrogenase